MTITTIIFDLGAVLIDWDPRHLYRKIFANETEMEEFLANVCTFEWNEAQDAGRLIDEANKVLIAQFPQHEEQILAFYGRWEEMLGGEIPGTVAIFERLKNSGDYKFYALTNWSAETFPIALSRFPFLAWFDGIVVSGTERMRKPDPAFYRLLLDRFDVDPEEALFIDDNLRNVRAAEALGIRSIHFTGAAILSRELSEFGINL